MANQLTEYSCKPGSQEHSGVADVVKYRLSKQEQNQRVGNLKKKIAFNQ